MRLIRSLFPLVAGAGLLVVLSGCEPLEQSARQWLEQTEEVAKEKAREALGQTVEQLNQSVDQAQQSANEWLKPEEPSAPQPPARDAPPLPAAGQVET